MKPIRHLRLFAELSMALLLIGCATPTRVTVPAADHVGELLAHPQAKFVHRDYKDFFIAALNKIAELSHDNRLPQK